MWNSLLKKNVRNIDDSNIEEYERFNSNYSWKEELGGIRGKHFVRCTSDCFEGLFDELRNNPNCSYDTYMNDVIKSGYDPKFLSVLMRYTRVDRTSQKDEIAKCFKEVYASRVLNFFECPTTYDAIISKDNKIYSCSVDFVKEDEELYPLVDLYDRKFVPKKVLDFKKAFDEHCLIDNANEVLSEDVEKTIEDFVYSRLVRWYMCEDNDYFLHNMGVLYNTKTDTIRMAPNFDFDQSFSFCTWRSPYDSRYKSYSSESLIAYLDNIKKRYPKMRMKFISKLNEFTTKKNGVYPYEKLLGDERKHSKYLRDFVCQFGSNMRDVMDDIRSGMYRTC